MEQKWQKAHGQTIKDFLKFLNEKTDKFILKGDTALAQCYKLTRFSEDIDLDSVKENIIPYVEKFCQERKYQFRIAKDTETVKRCFVNYGNDKKPLKIEISYRRKNIPESDFTTINNIKVYTIDNLAHMKAMAYNARDKLRDMYDLAFICEKYWEEISKPTKKTIREALEYKGLEQFEYIVQTQQDELINEEELLTKFLQMYEKVELQVEEQNKRSDILERFGGRETKAEISTLISDSEMEKARRKGKAEERQKLLQEMIDYGLVDKKKLERVFKAKGKTLPPLKSPVVR